jgi:hypothetical protein
VKERDGNRRWERIGGIRRRERKGGKFLFFKEKVWKRGCER